MFLTDVLIPACEKVNLDEVTTVRPQKCNSFSGLVDIYEQDLELTQSFKDCLAICLAVHISTNLTGDPLWMYLVGAPSSGKSTICELLASDEIHTKSLSKFTGLMSGVQGGDSCNHLIPLLNGMCVIIKDGTLLLESSQQQLANVYGELRDIFDGSLDAHYRNGVTASFKGISFSMVIGITERVYALNMAALGERFLHCRLESNRESETIRNSKVMDNLMGGMTLIDKDGPQDASRAFPRQRAYTAGFLSHLHTKLTQEPLKRITMTPQDKRLVQSLADVIACSRAEAPRDDRREEIMYETRPEASTRVVKQLIREAYFLTYVLNTTEITDYIRFLLGKICKDTAFSRQYSIIHAVAVSDKGLQRNQIAAITGISLPTISRKIEDLIHLGIFEGDKTTNRPTQGRVVSTLTCTDWVRNSFRAVAGLESFNA